MTRDLIKTVIDSLGSTLTEVYINELREGTFFAKLMLDGFETEIDSRPSDAIALAVRYGAPIYIQDSILTDAGFLPEGENDDDEGIEMPETPSVPEEKPQQPKKVSTIEMLQHQLDEAISQEDYERAAQLRDELKRMERIKM